MACERQLIPGDSFALKDEGLYCNEHHKVCDKSEDGGENNNNKNILNNNSNNSEDGDDKSEEGKKQKNITSFHRFITKFVSKYCWKTVSTKLVRS